MMNREKRQCKMMKNRETTMKNDEYDEKKQRKILKKREQNNEK